MKPLKVCSRFNRHVESFLAFVFQERDILLTAPKIEKKKGVNDVFFFYEIGFFFRFITLRAGAANTTLFYN